jgi:hypothetical protein
MQLRVREDLEKREDERQGDGIYEPREDSLGICADKQQEEAQAEQQFDDAEY